MSLDLSRIPTRRQGAEGSTFGQEFVVLDPPGRMLRGLNETGARVWALLENGRDLASIADAVASEYDVDPDRAVKDVQAVIARLQEEQLIAPS